jgi:hypothetical protein
VGAWVWLRLHHRIAATLTNKAKEKLAPKYYGPFRLLEHIGTMAYRLELPPNSRIHDVFHVVFLKKFVGEPPTSVAPLSSIENGIVLPIPEKAM